MSATRPPYSRDIIDRIFAQEGPMAIRIRQVATGDRPAVARMSHGEYVWLAVDTESVVDGLL